MIKKICQAFGVILLGIVGLAAIIAFLGMMVKGIFIVFMLGYNTI